MSSSVLAPGKLVLVGEYAVLDGGPALVQAIDRGVRCDVVLGGHQLHIQTPDGDDRFVRPALQGARPGAYRFSAWNPVDLPGKPGFGGSAAACVAACLAAGRPAEDARAIHHQVQGGGSGIDVAASVYGGTLRFQAGTTTPASAPTPAVVYSGSSARTGPRVARYRAWADGSPAHRSFLERSASVVAAFADDPILAARESLALLRTMSLAAGIDYLTPALVRITQLALAHHGAAKPSGAGGGDVAVAWFRDPDDRRAFLAACQSQGLAPIEVHQAAAAASTAEDAPSTGPRPG